MPRRKLARPQWSLSAAVMCLVLAFLADTAHSQYTDCADCINLYYEPLDRTCEHLDDVLSCLESLDCSTDFSFSIFFQNVQSEFASMCDDLSPSPTPTPTTAPPDPLVECAAIYASSPGQCSVLWMTRDCLQQFDCSSLQCTAFQGVVESALAERNCSAPPSLPPSLCPSLPVADASTVQPLAVANVVPEPGQSCVRPETVYSLEHCSAFTLSHVRPFKRIIDVGIQTCSLPGSWYLFKHSAFDVEVEGAVEGEGEGEGESASPTRLRKVKVNFFSDQCMDQDLSYSASSSSPFPQSWDSGPSQDSHIQLSVSADGSAVVLLSPWLNSSVIIRRFSGYLSVTVQVPGAIAIESQGLCHDGCPAHAGVSRTDIINAEECNSDKNNANLYCFLYPGIQSQDVFYPDHCVFDLVVTKELALLTMYNSTVRDALQLPNIGVRDLATAAPPTQHTPTSTSSTEDDTPSTTEDDTPSTTEQPPASGSLLDDATPSSSALLSLQPLWFLLLTVLAASVLR